MRDISWILLKLLVQFLGFVGCQPLEGLVDLAREEGLRLGLQEGIAHARRLGFGQARSTPD